MSCKCLTTTSQYLVRLKNLWMDKAVKKTFVSNLRKMSQQKSHNYLVCEFTAHYSCRNEEMKLKSTMTNWFIFQTIISLIESWGVWPGLTVGGKWGEKGGGGGGGGFFWLCRFQVQRCVWVAREKVVACRGLAVSMVIIAFQEVVSGGKETTPGWFILRLYPCN